MSMNAAGCPCNSYAGYPTQGGWPSYGSLDNVSNDGNTLSMQLGSDTLNSQSPVVMKLDKMVSVAMKGLEKDTDEIRPGMSNVMKWMSRVAPNFILKQVNKSLPVSVNPLL